MLILIEEMRQKTNSPFQKMLKRKKKVKLNSCDFKILNQKLSIKLSTSSSLHTVIVVQKKQDLPSN